MTEPRLLGQRYELGETIGHGGMAEVHRARDVRLGRDVAVKVLRQDLARDPSFQVRFRREAQASAALNHPAIVAVFDTGEDAGTDGATPYIVMEYVDGQTLRTILKAEGTLPTQRAMAICADICAALDFSHRNGIVHRDVKPGNVMISPNGAVKVMDFGIARAVSDSAATVTSTAAVIGTAQYLSPEQARGENVDARSDVYSCGCVLYELLTGSPPFTGDSPVAVAYQHVREDPIPPSEAHPGVPAALDSIVLKAMSKNPANRYQSAAEMRADLIRAQEGQPVEATPLMSPAERTTVIAGVPRSAAARHDAPRYRQVPEPRVLHEDRRDSAQEGGRSGRTAGYILLALALVGIVIAAALLIPRLAGQDTPASVLVPNLAGLTRDQALDELTGRGLALGQVSTEESSAAEKDLVIRQDPNDADEVAPDSVVDIVLGAGPSTAVVPEIVGLTEESAVAQLQRAGLVVAQPIREQSSAEPAGRIVESSPAPGETVAAGSSVTLFRSTGTLALPSLLGQSCTDATTQLNGLGFNNVICSDVPTEGVEPGTVIAQDPGPGQVSPTNRITLSVASAPPPVTTTTPIPPPTDSTTPTPPPTPTT